MSRPPVTVIVVLHDGLRYIERCLRSVLAQGYPGMQLIVVDNASADGGRQRVAARFPEVTLIASPENRGYAAGINLGLAAARGALIAPLNADVEVAPGWLDALVEHLEDHPAVGAVTPLILVDQRRDQVNALGGAIHPTGMSFCNGLGRPRASVPGEPFPVPGVSGASYLIRAPLLRQMGGAPEFCFMGNDDVVLSWILRLMGHGIACVPASVVYHRYNLTLGADKLYLVERNRWQLLLTALERRTLLRRLPAHLALEAAVLVYCGIRGPRFLGAKARAAAAALADPGELRARRRAVQALRQVSDAELFTSLSPSLAWDQLLSLTGRGRPREESL